MKKRNSVPFFTKVPFSFYKNAAVGHSPNPAHPYEDALQTTSQNSHHSQRLYPKPLPSTP